MTTEDELARTATAPPRDPDSTLAVVKNAASSHFSVVDLADRSVVEEVGEGRYPHTVLFHPDGRHAYLLYISSAHLEVVDRRTWTTVGRVDDLGTMSVGSATTPAGDRLFVGTGVALPDSETPGVQAFEIPDDDPVPVPIGSRELSRCTGMGVAQDGTLLVGQKERGEVVALSADADLERVATYRTGEKPHDLYPVPDTSLVAVNNAGESYVSFLDVDRRERLVDARTGANPHGFAVADGPDFRRAIVPARDDDRVAVVDVEAAARGDAPTRALVDVGTTTGFAATTPDGRYALVDSYDENHVTVIDVASAEVAGRVEVGGEPLHLAFSPDGTECYVGNMELSSVAVLDTGPLLDGRPGDVTVAGRVTGLGQKPSGIFLPEVRR